mmetsp:Transcript_15345/g.52412  ORF Transcript_15345/g.52412 Transcript_15345/m.52412 type:complete len:271 (-) Transcript_15345:499-1311(-)
MWARLCRDLRLDVCGGVLDLAWRPPGLVHIASPTRVSHIRLAHLRHRPCHRARDIPGAGSERGPLLACVWRERAERRGRNRALQDNDALRDDFHLCRLHLRRDGLLRADLLRQQHPRAPLCPRTRAYLKAHSHLHGPRIRVHRDRHGAHHSVPRLYPRRGPRPERHRHHSLLWHIDGSLHQAQSVQVRPDCHYDGVQVARNAGRDVRVHIHGSGRLPRGAGVGQAGLLCGRPSWLLPWPCGKRLPRDVPRQPDETHQGPHSGAAPLCAVV